MITMEYLYMFTKTRSEINAEDEKQVSLVFGPEVTADEIILSLIDYFGQPEQQQQAVRLVVGGEERGYLLRNDLYNLMPLGGTRGFGFGESDGLSLPGDPSDVSLTELRCPIKGCPQVVFDADYDEDDPPMCPAHNVATERCK